MEDALLQVYLVVRVVGVVEFEDQAVLAFEWVVAFDKGKHPTLFEVGAVMTKIAVCFNAWVLPTREDVYSVGGVEEIGMWIE